MPLLRFPRLSLPRPVPALSFHVFTFQGCFTPHPGTSFAGARDTLGTSSGPPLSPLGPGRDPLWTLFSRRVLATGASQLVRPPALPSIPPTTPPLSQHSSRPSTAQNGPNPAASIRLVLRAPSDVLGHQDRRRWAGGAFWATSATPARPAPPRRYGQDGGIPLPWRPGWGYA